jgi:proteasome lid subunit RPN8/RPN11
MNHHNPKWKAIMNSRTTNPVISGTPPIRMSRHVSCQIMSTIGARPAESGGILLGPIGCDNVTEFFFDRSALCSGAAYTPDHVTLRRKMKEEWMPSGLDLKGFVHSQPASFNRLSAGDLAYIRRLLQSNPDMSVFAAPIVLPQTFQLLPIVVLADQPHLQRLTTLQLF